MNFFVTLVHPNGERKTVPVEYVAPNCSYVTIRWELSGSYDLNLAVNVLTPCYASQNRGKAKWYKKDKPLWKAENISEVRRAAREYIDEKAGNPHSKKKASYKTHLETMPNPKRA